MTTTIHRRDPKPRYRGTGTRLDAHAPEPAYARPGVGTPTPAGRVAVTCWCEAQVVLVSLDDVRSGLTGSCRRLACQRTDDDRREDLR